MTLGDEGRLRAVVLSEVEAAGFDLEELTVKTAGRRRMVRVVIDSDDGVDLDAAAAVSREISRRLDGDPAGEQAGDASGERAGDSAGDSDHQPADEAFGGAPYVLEVTSPGVGRPLTQPRHFRRAAGRLVGITLADGSTRTVRIRRVTGDVLAVLTGPDGLTAQEIPLSDISRAKVEVEFGAPPPAVAALLAADRAGEGPTEGADAE